MSTKTVKGLLKGLRYISKVFDEEENEPEMQIGYPTDVKHVAHIGWDGPDNNKGPTWMNDFKGNPDDDSSPTPRNGHDAKEGKMRLAIPSKDGASSSPVASPSQRTADGTKKSRNHRRHTPNSSIDSPTKRNTSSSSSSSSTGNHRSSRRNTSSAQGTEPSSQDSNQPGVTKKVRRRRKVSSEGGGSTKSTKSKGKDSSMDGADVELAGTEFVSQG
ncbi:hypothetical protein QQ045_023094 [Rhodiola kirilowii]